MSKNSLYDWDEMDEDEIAQAVGPFDDEVFGFEEEPMETKFKTKYHFSIEQILSELEKESHIASHSGLTIKERIRNIDRFVIHNNQVAGEKSLLHISIRENNEDMFLFLINERGYLPFDLNSKDKADIFNVYFYHPDFLDVLWKKTDYFKENSIQLAFHNAGYKYIFSDMYKSLFISDEKIINFINNKFLPCFSKNVKTGTIKIEESDKKTIYEVMDNNLNLKKSSNERKYINLSYYNNYMNNIFDFKEKDILLAGLQRMESPEDLKLFVNLCRDMKVNTESLIFKNYLFRFLDLRLKKGADLSSYFIACPEEINNILLFKDKDGDNIFHRIAVNMNPKTNINENNLTSLLITNKKIRFLLNEKNEEGETPSVRLIKRDKEHLIPLLLLHDADMNPVIPLLKNKIYLNMIMEYEKNKLENSVECSVKTISQERVKRI